MTNLESARNDDIGASTPPSKEGLGNAERTDNECRVESGPLSTNGRWCLTHDCAVLECSKRWKGERDILHTEAHKLRGDIALYEQLLGTALFQLRKYTSTFTLKDLAYLDRLSTLEKTVVCQGYCGSLFWTFETYGQILHKDGCPYRHYTQGNPPPKPSM